MSDDTVVETVYGKHHKYEIVKKPGGVFSSTEYVIRRDGKHFKGPYKSLSDAVETAKEQP